MIVARNVFQLKFGSAQEVVPKMKTALQQPSGNLKRVHARLLTDLTGQFFTLVLETEHENLAAWESYRAELFASPEFLNVTAAMSGLVESGRSEIYTLELETGA